MRRVIILIFMGLCTACTALANQELSEQAKLLYADNNISAAFDTLLRIPEDSRTSENWLFLGNILHDTRRNEDALSMYVQAVIKDPKNYKALYNSGNIYLENQDAENAISEYKKAIKIKEDFAYAHYNLGCAYIMAGKLRAAKNEFFTAISYLNTEPDFYYNLAYVYKRLNKEKTAKQYLEIYNKMDRNI